MKNSPEPTISDVLSAVQDLAEAMQTGFVKMEERMEERFNQVDARFDQVDERLDSVEYRVTALEKRAGATAIAIEEIKETLDSVAQAGDKDAVTVIGHERRIVQLEELCATCA